MTFSPALLRCPSIPEYLFPNLLNLPPPSPPPPPPPSPLGSALIYPYFPYFPADSLDDPSITAGQRSDPYGTTRPTRYQNRVYDEEDEEEDDRASAITIAVLCVMGVAFIVGVVFLIYSSGNVKAEYDKGDKEGRGVGGTVDSEPALRFTGTILSRVRVPPPLPWPDEGLKSQDHLAVAWLSSKTKPNFSMSQLTVMFRSKLYWIISSQPPFLCLGIAVGRITKLQDHQK
ncbi:hypothetical protein PoB_005992600 [Plakobranchus ocellatus]|uniref:Uncharacterized protein n=1 Tax=Plakobranchus ocellatus TaxID=259542 RepID=A0AAV4CNH5_9GAST|nr:hypothetical protein PoB_005992600 [Plakobranchus ocellatus]